MKVVNGETVYAELYGISFHILADSPIVVFIGNQCHKLGEFECESIWEPVVGTSLVYECSKDALVRLVSDNISELLSRYLEEKLGPELRRSRETTEALCMEFSKISAAITRSLK